MNRAEYDELLSEAIAWHELLNPQEGVDASLKVSHDVTRRGASTSPNNSGGK